MWVYPMADTFLCTCQVFVSCSVYLEAPALQWGFPRSHWEGQIHVFNGFMHGGCFEDLWGISMYVMSFFDSEECIELKHCNLRVIRSEVNYYTLATLGKTNPMRLNLEKLLTWRTTGAPSSHTLDHQHRPLVVGITWPNHLPVLVGNYLQPSLAQQFP